MDIQILELIEGARRAEGLTVIIDVFRAFSLEAFLFHAGAGEIYAVGKEETARSLKERHPDYILVGERGGKILPGFDYGNSPSQMKNVSLTERKDGILCRKTVIHTTSAGTQGLVNAIHADRIITGSLLNAKAVADYIRRQNPDKVSLVAMGRAGKISMPEDVLCARYIKSLLENQPLNMPAEIDTLSQTHEARKFFNPDTQDIFPQEDYTICTDYDRVSVVLEATKISDDIFLVAPVRDFIH